MKIKRVNAPIECEKTCRWCSYYINGECQAIHITADDLEMRKDQFFDDGHISEALNEANLENTIIDALMKSGIVPQTRQDKLVDLVNNKIVPKLIEDAVERVEITINRNLDLKDTYKFEPDVDFGCNSWR